MLFHSSQQKCVDKSNIMYNNIVIVYSPNPVWSYWSPIGCLPGWQTGDCPPDMEGTGEIKYPGQTKTSTAALRLTEGSVKARGRKPRKQITWSSRLGVMQRARYPSMENFYKLKILSKGTEQDGLTDVDKSEDKGI